LLRNRKWRGNSIDVIGKKLQDVLPLLKREVLDCRSKRRLSALRPLYVIVEVEVKKRKYNDKTTKIIRTFRLVCVYNEDAEKYHIYLTNIPVDCEAKDGSGHQTFLYINW
jgi:hypothetical protein